MDVVIIVLSLIIACFLALAVVLIVIIVNLTYRIKNIQKNIENTQKVNAQNAKFLSYLALAARQVNKSFSRIKKIAKKPTKNKPQSQNTKRGLDD